jgi:hypothetical protein
MTVSSGGTPQTCPNGHPIAFAGQRFCEVCRMQIGGPAGPAAPQPPSLPVAPPPAFAPPPAYFAPPPVAPLRPVPYALGAAGRGGGRSVLPVLLGLAVCLVVVAAAAFVVVGHPFGGGGASPSLTPVAVSGSPAVTLAAVAAPPAPTNFTATRKSGSVPCPSANESCSQTDLAWQSTADPSAWFRIYWAGTGLDPAATCLTVAADAKIRLETKPAARTVSVFDPMAVGGGEICWWITAVNSTGESAQVPAAGQ